MSCLYDTLYYKDKNDNPAGYIEIYPDDWAENPRDWDCNICHMACWSSRYSLGDYESIGSKYDPDKYFDSLVIDLISGTNKTGINPERKIDEELKAKFKELVDPEDFKEFEDGEWFGWSGVSANKIALLLSEQRTNPCILVPLNIYDHSGITMYTGPLNSHFDSRWDCSQVGYIWVTKKDLENAGFEIPDMHAFSFKANKLIDAEVKTYSDYIEGNVFYAQAYVLDGDPEYQEDSCGGFIGSGKELKEQLVYCFFGKREITEISESTYSELIEKQENQKDGFER